MDIWNRITKYLDFQCYLGLNTQVGSCSAASFQQVLILSCLSSINICTFRCLDVFGNLVHCHSPAEVWQQRKFWPVLSQGDIAFFFFSWFENLMVVFNSAKFSGGSPRDYSMATQVDCETDRLELLHSPLQSRTYFHSIARS